MKMGKRLDKKVKKSAQSSHWPLLLGSFLVSFLIIMGYVKYTSHHKRIERKAKMHTKQRLDQNKQREQAEVTGAAQHIDLESEMNEEVAKEVSGSSYTLFTRQQMKDSEEIYLSILGRVYDVSSGASFYGEGGSYEFLSRTDATKAFATGDFINDITDDLEGLGDEAITAIDSWLSFFDKSKYPFVRYLEDSAFVNAGVGDGVNGKGNLNVDEAKAFIDFKARAKEGELNNQKKKDAEQCHVEMDIEKNSSEIWCIGVESEVLVRSLIHLIT